MEEGPAQLFELGVVERPVEDAAARHAPVCLARVRPLPRLSPADAEAHERTELGARSLPALPVHAAYLAAHPHVEVAQRAPHVGEPEVPDPSVHEASHAVPSAVERPAAGTRQDLPDLVPERRKRPGVRAEAQLPAGPVEGVAEVLDVARYVRDERLVAVDPEEQLGLHELGDRPHRPLRRLAAPLHDDEVVRVAHERVAAPLQLPVQLVQEDVRQKRRERPALRGALGRRLDDAVHGRAGHQEAMDEGRHPLVREGVRQQLHQLGLVDRVEEALEVRRGDPHAPPVGVALDREQRVVRGPSGAEAVRVGVEPRLEYGRELLRHGLLDHAVYGRWYAEQPHLPPLPLGNLDPPHGLGPVPPAEYPARQRVVVGVEPRGKLRHAHAVHAARAAVPDHALARCQHVLA